jgi:hypothetical protein
MDPKDKLQEEIDLQMRMIKYQQQSLNMIYEAMGFDDMIIKPKEKSQDETSEEKD